MVLVFKTHIILYVFPKVLLLSTKYLCISLEKLSVQEVRYVSLT